MESYLDLMKRKLYTSAVVIGIILVVAVASVNCEKREAASSTSSATPAKKLEWLDYDAGLQKALKEKKPIMIKFYADWCYYCKKMDNDTFSNTSVIEYLKENFVTISVNSDKERELASKYGIKGLPTTWLLKYNATAIGQLPGYFSADQFIDVLKSVKDKY